MVRDGSGDVATPVVRAPALPIAAAAPAPPPEPRASVHVVRPGDNLWLIARRTLIEAGNTRPADTEIARYWQIVIAANRATLRSGDPSLIFPGELVALPAPRLTQ